MTDDTQETETPETEEPENELDAKLKEAQTKKDIAEAEKAEAVAKADKLKAQFPSSEAETAEGKITMDEKAGNIAAFAAYDALIPKADEIAEKINGLSLKNARILIVDSLDFAGSDIQLLQVLKQIGFWAGEFDTHLKKIIEFTIKAEKLIQPPEPTMPKRGPKVRGFAPEVISNGLQAAKGVVGLLADIAGYFKVDYEIKGQTVNLANTVLHSLVAGRIDTSKHTVFLPGFFRIKPSATIKVLDDFNQCIIKKDRLKVAITELKELLISPELVSKKNDDTDEKKGLIDEAEKACENAGTLIKNFADFNKSLSTAPESGGYSPLAAAALRQYLDDLGITHLLYLNITSSVGVTATGKGLFYWGSPAFLGGCVVTYVLAACSGEILAAGTSLGYSGVKYHLCRNKLEFKPRK